MYQTGREASAGLGKESVYGTAVAPTAWYPDQEFTVSDAKETITDNSGTGTRDETLAVDVDHNFSEGNFNGLIYLNQFPNMALAAMGSITTEDHETATGVKVHTILPGVPGSFTLGSKDKNASVRFAGAMCNQLVINGAVKTYANFTSAWLGRRSTSTSNTVAFTDDLIRFRPKDITLKYASSTDGLGAASPKPFQQFSLTLANNIEKIPAMGSADPDYWAKTFAASLSLDKTYFDTEFKDLVFGSTPQAFQIAMTRSDISIGSEAPTHPSIVITFEPGYFSTWQKDGGLDDVTKEKIEFQPIRSFSTSRALSIVVTNEETSY